MRAGTWRAFHPNDMLSTWTGWFRKMEADSLNFSSDSVVRRRQCPCRVHNASISGCRCR